MTFYKNIGSITFQYETPQLQVFSASDSSLIFQFKNHQNIDPHCLAALINVYESLFRDESILKLYTQKNKPVSILLQRARPVSFEQMNVHLLCKIIKQMSITILQTRKVVQNKIGEISKSMFFQIQGNLRYLYFPIINCNYQEKQLVAEMVQFFNSLRDQKQVSQKLLLKKISKCVTLESIVQETEYFMSVYHSKQSSLALKHQKTASQQAFFTRTIKNPYIIPQKITNQSHKINLTVKNNQLQSSKNTTRRKFNLFKDTESKSFRNSNSSSNFNISTWRRNNQESFDQNATLRSNSKTLHVGLTHRSTKKQNSQVFQRNYSLGHSQQKFNHRKFSNKIQNQNNFSQQNESFIRQKTLKNSRQQKRQMLNISEQGSRLRSSRISQNQQEFLTTSKQMISQQNMKNQSDSGWMKQMVNNSLEKWRQKSKQKVNIFARIQQENKQKYFLKESPSKLIQKINKDVYEEYKDEQIKQEISCFFKKAGENLTESTQFTTFTPIESQSKLNRISEKNHSTFVETPNHKSQQQKNLVRNSADFEYLIHKNYVNEQKQPTQNLLTQNFQKSSQQIRLCQSSIEQITLKNQAERLKVQKQRQQKNNLPQQNKSQQNKLQELKEAQKPQTLKTSKKNKRQSEKNEIIDKKQPEKDDNLLQLSEKLKQVLIKKQQINFIGVAVVQTTDHLKSFQSIFWQLPMFFLYKKFYQKRLQLSKNLNQLLANCVSQKQENFQQLSAQIRKNNKQVSQQNENIEQSLKKLLKTVKKKIKKQYPRKQQQLYIEKHLHLDFTIQYDQVADEFISMYSQSLLEAKAEFPELVFHIIDIFEAVSVWKGHHIDIKQKQCFDPNDKEPENIKKAEKYFNSLLKKKEIKSLIQFEEIKPKKKK